jgi:hypothetical protein
VTAPAVSVVLYVRDGARYLPELLDSVLGQTFADFEVCAVDDGSTDATPDILKGTGDPRVRVASTAGNGRDGLHRTFNQALAMTRAGLVAVANADDVWRPTKLEPQHAEFAADPRLDVCFHDATFVDAAGRVTYGSFRNPASLNPLEGLRGRTFVVGDPVPNPTVMFRREIVRVVGLQETGWVHDYQFWMKAAMAGCTFRGLTERLIKYRVHPGGHSTGPERVARIRAESLEMLRWMLPRHGIVDLYPELGACTDGPASEAYVRLDLASLLERGSLPDLAAEQVTAARRLAPTRVGAGDTGADWYGPPPEVAARLKRPLGRPERLRLPAARTVVSLPSGVPGVESLERVLAEAAADPREHEPILILTDTDRASDWAVDCYAKVTAALGPASDPQIQLLQVRRGELDSVVEANLLDGGRLVTGAGVEAGAR